MADEQALTAAQELIAEETELRVREAEANWWAAHLESAGIESSELDELVHDLASRDATSVNNGGLEAQVHFVMDRLGSDEAVEQTLRPLLLRGIANQINETSDASRCSRFVPETAEAAFQLLNPLWQMADDGELSQPVADTLQQVQAAFERGRKV